MIEAELHDGRILEFPEGTHPDVIQSTVKKILSQEQPKLTSISGIAAEAGKGIMRGLSDVSMLVGEAGTNMMLGPVVGSLAAKSIKTLAAPSRELISAKPASETERFAGTAAEIAGGSIPGGGLGGLRALLGTGVAALGGATGEQVGGQVGKFFGTFTPASVSAVARMAKNVVSKKVTPTVEKFRSVGAEPSVGQATDSVFLHGLENLASKFPGGAGIMKSFIEQQQKQIGSLARTETTAETAGRAIEKGITGRSGFLARTKAVWQMLDDAVAAKIPSGSRFIPANTLKSLDDLTTPVTGAEKTTAALVNPKLADMKANLIADLDANNGNIPFEALRALRTKVGSMLDDALVSGVPGGELKKVYGALSRDLEVAANQAGAGQEFARQNNFYRARMERIESVLDRVIGKDKQPEDIFKAIDPTNVDQVNKLRLTMRSLQPAEREMVMKAVVNKLGRAAPGRQSELGNVFSSETFLTNWNRLSTGAKQQLFPDLKTRINMNRIAEASANLRIGRGIYANPSGTAGSFAAYSVYMSPFAATGAAIGGPAGAAVGILTAAGGATLGANIGAKLLTNPKIVDWLATPISPSKPGQIAIHLGRLIAIYKDEKDSETRQEIAQFVQSASSK